MLLTAADIEIIDKLCIGNDEAYQLLLKCLADKVDLSGKQAFIGWLEDMVYELESRARNGKAPAMALLSEVYFDGLSVPVSTKKALDYARRGASLNDPRAEVMLGFMYANGYGVQADFKRAMKFFELAISKGNSMALNNMGAFYEDGLGVKKNLALALKYYKQAAEMKNKLAIENLKRLQENKPK